MSRHLKVSSLQNMSQFVSQKASSRRGIQGVTRIAKNNVTANRIGIRVNRSCGLSRCRVSVDADVAEIMAKTTLHEAPCVAIERLPGRVEHLSDDRRN